MSLICQIVEPYVTDYDYPINALPFSHKKKKKSAKLGESRVTYLNKFLKWKKINVMTYTHQ